MRLLTYFALAALLLTAPFVGSRAADSPIGLNKDILIEGPVVQLQDIFFGLDPAGRAAGTPVAKAPAAGQSVELDARWLAALARAYGIDWQPRSALDTARVSRSSRAIEAPRLKAAILEALNERGLKGRVRVALDQAEPRLLLPRETDDSLAVKAFTYDDRSGRFFAQIVVPAEGTPVERLKLTGIARVTTEVPTLRRRIKFGEVIEASDIEWIEIDEEEVGRNTVLAPENLIGMTPRRAIAPNRPVRAGDLRLPVLVAKSSLVTIELVAPGMRLSVRGRAMEDGAKGEAIRVMNTQSKKVVTATVRDRGSVTVSLVQQTAGLE